MKHLLVTLLVFPILAQRPSSVKQLEQARDLYQKEDYETCIQICTDVLNLEREFLDAFLLRGWAYFKAGHMEWAENDFHQAVKLDKHNARALNARARARWAQGKTLRATRDCKKALKEDPQLATAHVTMGLLEKDRGDENDAMKSFEKALSLDPQDVEAWNHLGLIYAARDQHQLAEQCFSQSLRLEPGNDLAQSEQKKLKGKQKSIGAVQSGGIKPTLNKRASQGKRSEGVGSEGAKTPQDPARQARSKSKGQIGKHSMGANLESDDQGKETDRAETPELTTYGEGDLPQLDYDFHDPCASTGAEDPWNPNSVSEPRSSTGGTTLAPFSEMVDLAKGQYNGIVSTAMEGMRLLYGSLTDKEAAHFEATWAAMFDHPSAENQAYLQKLVPLLGQYLGSREAYFRCLAGMRSLHYELILAVAADSEAGYRAVMESAVDLNREIQSLLKGLSNLVAQIEAIGAPLNPADEKCQAQSRYRRSFPKKAQYPLRGLEGEWVGYVESDAHSPYQRRVPVHYFFRYHLDKNPFVEEPMESLWGAALAYIGRPSAAILHWTQEMVDNQDGDLIEFDYENEGKTYTLHLERVNDELPAAYEGLSSEEVSRLEKLEKRMRENWYQKNKIQMSVAVPSDTDNDGIIREVDMPSEDESVEAEPTPGPSVTFEGEIAHYNDMNLYREKELELGLELTEINRVRENLMDYLKHREVFHLACVEWMDNPPEESYDGDARVKQFRELMNRIEARLKPSEPIAADRADAAAIEAARQKELENQARQQGIQDSIAFHDSMVQLLKRQLQRERQALSEEKDGKRRDQLAFRVIQIQSNIQAEQDLADSYRTGQVIHRRSAFDEFANRRFIQGIKQRVARVDAVRRIKRGIERQIDLLPEDRQADLRKKARDILDPQCQASGDVGKARRLAVAVNNQVQGYWEHEAAMQESIVQDLNETEFYFQTTLMVCGGFVTSLGSAAMVATYGEAAAVTVLSPYVIGGVYGAGTGYIVGGPREGIKQSVAGVHPYGAFAAEFVDTWLKESENPNSDFQTKLWNATKNAGIGLVMAKTVEFSANTIVKGGIHFFGKDSRLFQPVFSTGQSPGGKLMVEASKMQQAVDDAQQYMGLFKQKQLEFMKLKSSLPAGSPKLAQLDQELGQMAASINSSFHGKWLMKYKAHPSVRRFYQSKVQQSYDDMMPDMVQLLRQRGYDMDGVQFKPIRNASSQGSSSMDLDLALVERPGMVLRKNGKAVSLDVFQADAQQAMNVAYHNQTGYSAVRSELNLTTSQHDESFSNLNLLKDEVDFSKIPAEDIAQIGEVVQVKIDKVTNDPVLSQIAKTQSRCRESSKEIKNMLLKKLKQNLDAAPPGSSQSQQLEADVRYWEDMLKRFDEMGSQESNPYRLIELEREIRTETGGKGSQEVIQDLKKMFQRE